MCTTDRNGFESAQTISRNHFREVCANSDRAVRQSTVRPPRHRKNGISHSPLPRRAVLLRDRQSLPDAHRCMRYARTQELFWMPLSGTAASNCNDATKKPRKTGAFHDILKGWQPQLFANCQLLHPQSPKRGKSPFCTEIRALFIKIISMKATIWRNSPLEEAKPTEAVLDIGGPFETENSAMT